MTNRTKMTVSADEKAVATRALVAGQECARVVFKQRGDRYKDNVRLPLEQSFVETELSGICMAAYLMGYQDGEQALESERRGLRACTKCGLAMSGHAPGMPCPRLHPDVPRAPKKRKGRA